MIVLVVRTLFFFFPRSCASCESFENGPLSFSRLRNFAKGFSLRPGSDPAPESFLFGR